MSHVSLRTVADFPSGPEKLHYGRGILFLTQWVMMPLGGVSRFIGGTGGYEQSYMAQLSDFIYLFVYFPVISGGGDPCCCVF